jgi:hypothetical protein
MEEIVTKAELQYPRRSEKEQELERLKLRSREIVLELVTADIMKLRHFQKGHRRY